MPINWTTIAGKIAITARYRDPGKVIRDITESRNSDV
jgi:hypothetical protein